MIIPDNTPCVGLFGTCGNSHWREQFITCYKQEGILFFNPQVEPGTWHPGMVTDENLHFTNDEIILFPVTTETTGQGSLAEIGFSIANALHSNPNRFFVFLIDEECNDPDADLKEKLDSVRSRKLVKSKLINYAKKSDNIFLVEQLEDMLYISLMLIKLIHNKNVIKQGIDMNTSAITGFNSVTKSVA